MRDTKAIKIHLGTFDLIKGLSIIVIILGHSLTYYDVEQLIILKPIIPILLPFQTGIIPVFFMISGFAFKEKSVERIIKKSFSELIKPYLYVMIATAICFPLCHYAAFRWWPGAFHESTRYFLAFLLGVPEGGKKFLGYELYWCAPVWFFLALFISLNLLNGILKLKNWKIQHILVWACAICGYYLAKNDINYFCIPQGLIGVGYCYIGFLGKKTKMYAHPKMPLICILLTIPTVIQGVWGEYRLAYGVFKFGFIECILSACAGVLLGYLGIICGNTEWKILNPIKNIGIHTYWILCVHAVETVCIPWYLLISYFADRQMIAFAIEACAKLIIIVVACMVLKQISKRKYRRLTANEKQ